LSLLSKLGSSGECNHKRSHRHKRVAYAHFFFCSWYKPRRQCTDHLTTGKHQSLYRERYTNKHKPTDRPGSSGKEERPSFFTLVDLQKLLSGFIRGLDVPWLHTGNQQHITGTKKQAAGPTKDTGPAMIVQYRANMKAGF